MTNLVPSANRAPDIGELFIAVQQLDALLAVIEECASDNESGRAFLLAQLGQVMTADLLKQFDTEVRHG
ncbi:MULTISPECIES: hypothetical protein [unclassified Caballeronia]|uniref:hypothetical protein n=1 Tax=unclassified Caballeronia TaxID=2646786 RepID=UPI002857657A|nr:MULTISPECIES: hypothetical protein [unclassified Caballeronia]MDR5770189.1 hypothetical protein [Caballeronia sp. LZ002]MDR5803454.1 hypothetical protein [Caballeronia sp. LZ001]MDR5845626.1 hypothetical protein [Caballeronia sp. LZ003]